MEELIIPFKGLSTGNHHFEFKIYNAFFENYSFFETEKGNLDVILDLEKETTLMIFHFSIKGVISLACDRCVAEFDFPIAGNYDLIVKFGDDYVEESDDVVVIPNAESRIDVSQYIFEYITLLLPIKRVHPSIDQCDPAVIEKLNKYSQKDADPRWDALKNIKLK
jgi:uncharacterized metal-binding protein YceD (DUF177 family)